MSLPEKKWSSLSQLKAWIKDNHPKEKILYFDGAYLKTSEAVYGLGSEKLYIWDKEREVIDVTAILNEEKLEESLPPVEEKEENGEPSPKKKKRRKKKVVNVEKEKDQNQELTSPKKKTTRKKKKKVTKSVDKKKSS